MLHLEPLLEPSRRLRKIARGCFCFVPLAEVLASRWELGRLGLCRREQEFSCSRHHSLYRRRFS